VSHSIVWESVTENDYVPSSLLVNGVFPVAEMGHSPQAGCFCNRGTPFPSRSTSSDGGIMSIGPHPIMETFCGHPSHHSVSSLSERVSLPHSGDDLVHRVVTLGCFRDEIMIPVIEPALGGFKVKFVRTSHAYFTARHFAISSANR